MRKSARLKTKSQAHFTPHVTFAPGPVLHLLSPKTEKNPEKNKPKEKIDQREGKKKIQKSRRLRKKERIQLGRDLVLSGHTGVC